MQYRLATALLAFVVFSGVFAVFLSPDRHPPEAQKILATLHKVPDNAMLKTAVHMLVDPLRPADGKDRSRPDANPRYYVDIADDYRLAIDCLQGSTGLVFEGARVETYNENGGEWNPIYPIRTSDGMQYSLFGR